MFARQGGNSPMGLRDEEDTDTLETYHPRMLATQQNGNSAKHQSPSAAVPSQQQQQQQQQSRAKQASKWLPRLATSKAHFALRDRLTQKMARLSSLDSTRSSSSAEVDSNVVVDGGGVHTNQYRHGPVMPLISITSNDNHPPATSQQQQQQPSQTQLRHEQYNNYYGRPRIGLAQDNNNRRSHGGRGIRHHHSRDDDDDDDDEDDDGFDEPPLPIPYSSSSMMRSNIVRQKTDIDMNYHTAPSSRLSGGGGYEDLLDDRQGMNSGEQPLTKCEKLANRPSLDGSIMSELRPDGGGGGGSGQVGKKLAASSGSGGGKSGSSSAARKDKQRRSKSPSSCSVSNVRRNRGHSRRGLFGLASRLKLTRKHESIAKLQLSILNSGFVSLKTIDRDLQTFLPKERMSPKEFEERVKLMRKYEVLATIEYRFASRYETYVCRHATQESNQAKNNYKKCIPYDYNRVVLKTLPNVPDSDYINASHVDSYLKPNAYIAAQGPNENTIEDFWRMVWEQKTFVIVMLTKVFDFIRVMCNQYWPVELNKPERYGNLEVTLLYEEPLADFVIRTIRLTRLRGGQQQQAAQATENGGDQTAATTTTTMTMGDDKEQQQQQATSSMANENGAYSANGGNDEAAGYNRRASQAATANAAVGRLPGNNNNKEDYYDEDEYSYDDYDDDEDDTSCSEELILNEDYEALMEQVRGSSRGREPSPSPSATGGGAGLPPVRAPRFVARPRRRDREHARKRTSSATTEQGRRPNSLTLGSGPFERGSAGELLAPDRPADILQPPPSLSLAGKQGTRFQGGSTPTPNAEGLLHPLFSSARLASSTSSIPSTPNTPMSPPLTPRTPSSAGLDRSSATRKAVKKKRRVRSNKARPLRTKFQVPDAQQLADDDDDEEDDAAAATGAAGGGDGASKANERIIYQFHYNSWASHTCPFISSLLHFRRRVRICMDEMSKSGKTGPTVVHCNDGCGRTGTYLCIDANLELAEEDNVYDVFNYAKKVRQSRKFLIENLEQYRFVYDTIEEAMFCGKTWFPLSELHQRLKHKSQRSPLTKKNEYLREYEKITRMTSKFSIGDCAGGHRVENREKNRDVSTVPPDNFRPYLTSFQTNDSTDYINAVFVDGYTRSKEYIVTEWPLHRTISDFWSLVYDHDCNSVILLANPGESSNYPSFLPSEKELRRKFGPVFSAEMVSYTHYQNIKSWIYTISKKIVSLTEVIAGVKSEAKTTQVFQITCWPQGHRVPTSTNALVELMNMVERWRQRTTYGPVCVVSLNGKSRAGVYCAANVAIEQVVQHSEVDVFQAVKTVRRHRPQLIENMTEYKYCYDLILHYVLHYVNQGAAAS